MRLIGKKTVLRDKLLEDAPLDYKWRSDEELARLDAAFPVRSTYEEFLRLFRDQLRYPTPGSARFGIEADTGHYIGNCMYYDYDSINEQTELGIVIGDKEYWGKGYGCDAVVTLRDYLFTDTKVKRIYLHTLTWNERAQKAFAKCGFQPVNNVRRSGMDFVLMDIYRTRWLDLKKAENASAPPTSD